MDTNRELRAATMAAFPCPPLPLVHGERPSANSHDFLAYQMDVAARFEPKARHDARKPLQQALLLEYVPKLAAAASPEAAFREFCDFTRCYMMLYDERMHAARFDMDQADRVKEQIASWLAAQHILKGRDSFTRMNFMHCEVRDLFRQCRDVLIE